MNLYDYDVEGEEAYFEPIEAEDVYQARLKIRQILAKDSVWAHGTQPFVGRVRMTDRTTDRPYYFEADCAIGSKTPFLASQANKP